MADIKVRMHLKNGEYIDVNKKNGLKSVESLSQTTGQPKEIFYGVTNNSGNFEIVDRQGVISNYIDKGVIDNSNIPVDLYVNDGKVQSHIITDSDFDTYTKTFSSSMNNDLLYWDKLTYKGYKYTEDKSETLYTILCDVLCSIKYEQEQIDEMLDTIILYGNNIKGSVKSYLELINVGYPYLPSDTIRNTIDKICTLAQLQVYKNDENRIKFVSARPNTIKDNITNAIYLPLKNQVSSFTENKLLKNKYEAVELEEQKVVDIIDYDKIVGTYNSNEQEYTISADSAKGESVLSDLTTKVYSFLYVDYYNFTVNIPKENDNGLEIVKKVYEGENEESEPYIKHTVTYLHKVGKLEFNVTMGYNVVWESETQESGQLATFGEVSYAYGSTNGSAAVAKLQDQTNLKIAKIQDNGDHYSVDLKVLVGLEQYGYLSNMTYPDTAPIERFVPLKLEVSVYGDKRVISFENFSVSDNNISQVSTFASVSTNELLQDKTTYNDTKISTIIKDNIKNDYKDGVSNSNLKTNLTNLFDIQGGSVKDFSKGEIIKSGDIVKVEGNNKIWQVTGRHFQYSGCPFADLELREVVNATYTLSITTENSKVIVIRNGVELQDGEKLYYGDKLFIKATGDALYTLNTLTLNGDDINNENYYIVTQNIDIVAKATELKYPQFSEANWLQVKEIVQNTEVFSALCDSSDYDWGIGLKKNIILPNGNTLEFRLSDIQIGRYDYVDGSRKTNAVFEMTRVLGNFGDFAMNTENTNAGGWAVSRLNNYLNVVAINGYLTAEMQSVIPTILVKSANGGADNYSGITESRCKLFIPSAEEVNLSSDYYYDNEGFVWDIYNPDKYSQDRTKLSTSSGTSGYQTWQLRSPYPLSTEVFSNVDSDGKGSHYLPSNVSAGISLCFAI